MGMTTNGEDRYKSACIKYLQKNMECVGYRDYIIERLNKYQKIEEIVGYYGYGFETSWLCLGKIREVLEDGND